MKDFGTVFAVHCSVNFNYMDTVEKLVTIEFKIPVTVNVNEDKEEENDNALEKADEILLSFAKSGDIWTLPITETCEDFPYIKNDFTRIHYNQAREMIANLNLATK